MLSIHPPSSKLLVHFLIRISINSFLPPVLDFPIVNTSQYKMKDLPYTKDYYFFVPWVVFISKVTQSLYNHSFLLEQRNIYQIFIYHFFSWETLSMRYFIKRHYDTWRWWPLQFDNVVLSPTPRIQWAPSGEFEWFEVKMFFASAPPLLQPVFIPCTSQSFYSLFSWFQELLIPLQPFSSTISYLTFHTNLSYISTLLSFLSHVVSWACFIYDLAQFAFSLN